MRTKQIKTEKVATRQKAPQKSADQIKKREWLAIRKRAGRKIDPETAEVTWIYAYDFDPYGIEPELPEEYKWVSRNYFARSPGSDIWVWFGDLPIATAKALWEKRKAKLAFPAGLPPIKEDATEEVSRDSDGNYVVQISESMRQAAIEAAEQMAKQAEQISGDYIHEADDAPW
jgi:hypothetical protein